MTGFMPPRFVLIAIVVGFLLVPAVPIWAHRVDCADGQTPPRQALQCDADGRVNGVCTFLRCRPCRRCDARVQVFSCNNRHPIVVPVGGHRIHGRLRLHCLPATPIRTVFLILLENYDWSSIKNSASAPYINQTLLPIASHAEQYYNPPNLHPSLPNYLWLEAGTNFGIFNDNLPSQNHQSTTSHLVDLLEAAGLSWRAYQEGINGTDCPITNEGNFYDVNHNPFVYFDDITGNNNPSAPRCIQHVRPYAELQTDLANNTVARYNFITPNQCHNMHDACAPLNDKVQQGDTWLSTEVPKILASRAYLDNGALFILWDEGKSGDGPIGMIVLSPKAKGGGYANTIAYDHSSTLRTVEEIFGLTPMLGGAARATDLRDLFVSFP